jgi:hypothetical protein
LAEWHASFNGDRDIVRPSLARIFHQLFSAPIDRRLSSVVVR